MLIEHMDLGNPFSTFAAKINVNVDTLYEWQKKHKKFSEARKIGQSKLEHFLYRLGLAIASGKVKGNPATWIFMMKNICNWTDRPMDQEIPQIEPVLINLPISKVAQKVVPNDAINVESKEIKSGRSNK